MFITILLLFVLILLVYQYYMHYGYMNCGRNGRLINLIPGPPEIPIFGNAFSYLGSQTELWDLLRKTTDKFYPITKIRIGLPVVSIRHPDDLETILTSTKNIEKSSMYEILHPWFGTGLLTSGGSKWYTRRKILTPTFHFNILQQFVEILTEESDRMTQSLKNAGGTVVKDLVPFLSEHTLNAICETAMGTPLQGLDTFQQKYREAVHQMGKSLVHRLMRFWLHLKPIFKLSPTGFQQRKLLKILQGFTEKIIAERKLYHERTNGRYLKNFGNEKITEVEDTEVIGSTKYNGDIQLDDIKLYKVRKKRLAMLDLLIAASQENHITDFDIREEVDTFMFEGHDTTAMGACFALLLLAEHKDIQDRVRTEIDTAMQKHGEKFTMTLLQNLPYLDRCIKESLRLYPSVHFISRKLSEDVKLQSYLVPADTEIHLNIYSVHRDPNFWPNPDVFDPDRFLPENTKNRHLYCYLPFSAGPRNCIGQRFAMLELKAIIASLIHNFYLEPIDYLKNLQIKVDLVLRPAHPTRVNFIPIERT